AVSSLDPVPQRAAVVGGPHVVSGAPQRLVEHGADGAIVIGDQDGGRGHDSSEGAIRELSSAMGSSTRNTVPVGAVSNSTTPPWSLTILATRARPSPVPPLLVVTKGSNRWAATSAGIPGPLSPTVTTSGK